MHHVLYVESDSVQIAKYGFLVGEPKSLWVELDDDEERAQLDLNLASLFRRGRIKLYFVSACLDDHTLEELSGEFDELDRTIKGGGSYEG
jgi:hypothetical protein